MLAVPNFPWLQVASKDFSSVTSHFPPRLSLGAELGAKLVLGPTLGSGEGIMLTLGRSVGFELGGPLTDGSVVGLLLGTMLTLGF